MASGCLGVIESEVVCKDSSCSLIPQKDRLQSNQTADLWLRLPSVRPRRREGAEGAAERERERLSHKRREGGREGGIKELLSPDDAQGWEQVNE